MEALPLMSGRHGQLIIFYTCMCDTGKWLYCVGEDGIMYIFDVAGGQLEAVLEVGEPGREIIGVSHHPYRNLLVTIADNGQLKFWKP